MRFEIDDGAYVGDRSKIRYDGQVDEVVTSFGCHRDGTFYLCGTER